MPGRPLSRNEKAISPEHFNLTIGMFDAMNSHNLQSATVVLDPYDFHTETVLADMKVDHG